jgi:DNA-binding transcriptional LysR family regulator
MRQMDISDARTFVVVAECGSISRAARELHLTQPAVTRRVQRLEQAIGAQLVDRRKRPFALTEIGQAAVERCRRIVGMRDELKSLAQSGPHPSRECRIGVAHALTELALSEPVDELRKSFPSVVLRLSTGWSRGVAERVRSGALDAGVVLLPEGDNLPTGLHGEVLAEEQLQIIGARAGAQKSRTPKEAAEAGWILSPEGCAGRLGLQKALGRSGNSLRVAVETYNYELQMLLVARQHGLGLVPERLLKRSPSRRLLRTLSVRGFHFPMTIWLLTTETPAALRPALAAFATSLKAKLNVRNPARSPELP